MKNMTPILLLWIFLNPVYAQQSKAPPVEETVRSGSSDQSTLGLAELESINLQKIEVAESPLPVGDLPAGTFSSSLEPSPGEYLVYKPGLPAAAGNDRSGATRSDTIPRGTSLVDNSTSHQQESEGSSAPEGAATLYLELEGDRYDTPYMFHLWRRYDAIGFSQESAQSRQVDISPYDFFRGMLPSVKGVLEISTGPLEGPAYIRISSEDKTVLNPYLIYPDDSVLVRVNSISEKIYFSGPDAAGFQLQNQLHLVFENHNFSPEQLMVVADKAKYMVRNDNGEKLSEAQKKFGRQLTILEKGVEELNWLQEELLNSDFEHKVDAMLKAYGRNISDEKLQKYKADILGKYYAGISQQLIRIIPALSSAESSPMLTGLLVELESRFSQISDNSWQVAGLVDFWIYLSEAKILQSQLGHLEWISSQELGYPRDLLLAYFFQTKGRNLLDLDSQLEAGLNLVSDLGIRARLNHIKAKRSLGAPVVPMKLITEKGDTVGLDEWKDQVVLVEFWLSGCGACLSKYEKIIKPLEEQFSSDPRFRIVAVSADRNELRWKGNIGRFSSEDTINLLAESTAFEAMREYGIDSYPTFLLLGRDAKILRVSAFPNDLESMAKLIRESLDQEFTITTTLDAY